MNVRRELRRAYRVESDHEARLFEAGREAYEMNEQLDRSFVSKMTRGARKARKRFDNMWNHNVPKAIRKQLKGKHPDTWDWWNQTKEREDKWLAKRPWIGKRRAMHLVK